MDETHHGPEYDPNWDRVIQRHFDTIDTISEEIIDKFEVQSGPVPDLSLMSAPTNSRHENVRFSDQHNITTVDVDGTMDPTRKLQDSNDASLQNFFERPIKIHEAEWGTGTSLGFDIDPWTLYWENPRVANRIANYNLLRCNLKIKVVINGNGFQYGRVLVAYQPFAVFDTLSTNASLVTEDLVGTSQLPHIYLDPTHSLGGEMKLPMFNYLNYIDVPARQWTELGSLLFRSLNDLKHANGASDRATISVFAWAEDVHMSVLTSVEQGNLGPQSGNDEPTFDDFEPQSGEIDEANAKGTISGPATSIAKWAGYLTKVPYISPFAIATETAANAVSSIAKIFGYSRPPVTRNPDPLRPTPMSSLALTNVPDTALKLTIDDKQELTIDPRIAGLGGFDPLNIRSIANRESYLTNFSWNIGTAPETLLWNARVTPVTWAESGSTAFHFPACAMAALPFQYWTGSMKFRFQIVASSFHKGRLKVVYDPKFFNTNEYNTNYLKIVDIAEEQDFTMEFGIGQAKNILEHHNPGFDSVTQLYSTTAYTSEDVGNGVVGVYVVNELTTPNSTVNNDIQINVFVSMGDDFEVFAPEDRISSFVFKPQSGNDDWFEAQSGLVPESENTMEPSAPLHEMSENIAMGESQDNQMNKVFIGESILSFRTLLKRYALFTALGSPANAGSTQVTGRMPHFPYLRGNVPGAVDTTNLGDPYNYCNTLLLHWIKNAFQGWRGSVRYKIIPRGVHTDSDYVAVQRAPLKPGSSTYLYSQNAIPTSTTLKGARWQTVSTTSTSGHPNVRSPFNGVYGQVVALGDINRVCEFEMPYQANVRFSPGKQSDLTDPITYSAGFDYLLQIHGDTTSVYDLHAAAGEDLQFYFFSGLPRMYYEPAPPNP